MNIKMLCGVGLVAALAFTASSHGLAQTPATAMVEGIVHDYTAALDASGPWHIVGDWSATVNRSSGKVEFQASLSMVRSDNAVRQAHTHHIRMTDGEPTPIANGYRITGTAAITNSGNLAPFSGSPVEIEITGGNAVQFSNFNLTFGGAAAGHYGADPIDGVVTLVMPRSLGGL